MAQFDSVAAIDSVEATAQAWRSNPVGKVFTVQPGWKVGALAIRFADAVATKAQADAILDAIAAVTGVQAVVPVRLDIVPTIADHNMQYAVEATLRPSKIVTPPA